MSAELTDAHYIRSTNQWSDPTTQCWLYGTDVVEEVDRLLRTRFGTKLPALNKTKAVGMDVMVGTGVLGRAS